MARETVFPIALAAEVRTNWDKENEYGDSGVEEVWIVAYVGGEKMDVGMVEMTGYEASQRPELFMSALIRQIAGLV